VKELRPLPGRIASAGKECRTGAAALRRTVKDMFKSKSGHDAAAEQKTYPVAKTDEEWREELSPEEYAVLRKAGTERAFTGEYTDTETTGVYRCKACRAALFESDTKFHSGCGWPSFYQPMTDTVEYIEDSTFGMKRVEVRCANCGSHLGHVFPDGYGTPTGDRYCINSVSIRLKPADA